MDPFQSGYANLSNLKYIESLYAQYVKDPESVDVSFRRFFEGMSFAESLHKMQQNHVVDVVHHSPSQVDDLRSLRLIEAYRRYGHLKCQCNPLNKEQKCDSIPELDIEQLGFKKTDGDRVVPTFGFLPQERVDLKTLISSLEQTYCTTLGVEAYHTHKEIQDYIYSRIEPILDFPFTPEEKLNILQQLNKSEMLESFIHMKYPGQKRFSLEGGESLIPLLLEMYKTLAEMGGTESILGMAHRGRLNVLANVLKKPYSKIFYEFEPTYMPDAIEGSGDVKYHLGMSSTIALEGGLNFKVSIADNPSHLESVNSVVLGITKAKQELKSHKGDKTHIIPVLIHGDASVAGQGVVYEGMQTMLIDGYGVGGSIHIVINNQVGFTATETESRSTRYPTDIAKAFGCPVFHVNGDDPEACCFAARLAAEVRQKFGIDVFIELLCFRKYGHNEGDEPAFTQPKLYEKIRNKPHVRSIYKEKLLEEKTLSQEKADELERNFREELEKALKETQEAVQKKSGIKPKISVESKMPLDKVFFDTETKVDKKTLQTLAEKFCRVPEGFNIHSKIQRLLNDRLSYVMQEKNIEWGLAEYLAYATLLQEGHPIRISGQDSRRGTFSHRHAVVVDQVTEEKYFPLQHLSKTQASFSVYNSCLSEYGILGFEFGYASVAKEGLTIWEAQFGDFANGAQILIDQYISSSETKWGLKSPLVLFLPHGYEGMGPEHSSARIERFLQLASNFNMEVVLPSCSAQMFHILRKHVISKTCKPLIVFTPKALLRFPPSCNMLNSFTDGKFEEIIDDPQANKSAKRILICSGKVYYDLVEEREKRKALDVAIIRIEKLYPFHKEKLKNILSGYKEMKECFYVQEEHSNMGAYSYLNPYLREILPDNLKLCYVGRARSASTAAGSYALHNFEKKLIFDRAFGKSKS